jgi:hypothetical protein
MLDRNDSGGSLALYQLVAHFRDRGAVEWAFPLTRPVQLGDLQTKFSPPHYLLQSLECQVHANQSPSTPIGEGYGLDLRAYLIFMQCFSSRLCENFDLVHMSCHKTLLNYVQCAPLKHVHVSIPSLNVQRSLRRTTVCDHVCLERLHLLQTLSEFLRRPCDQN